jgi:histidyl-tRNA synthetase
MTGMSELLKTPRGTRDILPPLSWEWQEVIRRAMDLFALAGYAPVETPIFEHTEVFVRGVGEASEVVNKEMYTFTDKGDRSLTLRPEMTAPVVRAVLENRLDRGALPVKLAYAGPMFRQERPQKGRYRQFSQFGIEAMGSDRPMVDAEVVALGGDVLTACGVSWRLLLNSIGHVAPGCRGGYLELLKAFLVERRDELAAPDRERVDTNPLRTFDSKEETTIAVMAEAPVITDHLCPECADHFRTVRLHLDALSVEYTVHPQLVRGLDYYTHTAFEFVSDALGAQSTVLGGGRYDGLSEALGGGPLPSVGFASGIDRVLLSGSLQEIDPAVAVYIVTRHDSAQPEAMRLAFGLRRAGIGADLDLLGRGMKGQMKDAARSGARWAVILEDEGLAEGTATLRDLAAGEQFSVAIDEIPGRVG